MLVVVMTQSLTKNRQCYVVIKTKRAKTRHRLACVDVFDVFANDVGENIVWFIEWAFNRTEGCIDKLNKSTSHFLCMSVAIMMSLDTCLIMTRREKICRIRIIHSHLRGDCDRRTTADNRQHDVVRFRRKHINVSRTATKLRRNIFV